MSEPDCMETLSGRHVYNVPPPRGIDLPFSCKCGMREGDAESPPPPDGYTPGDLGAASVFLRAFTGEDRWTQPRIITDFVFAQSPEWVPSHGLQSTTVLSSDREIRYIGTSGDRRARELAGAGILDRRHVGQFAEYRWPQP